MQWIFKTLPYLVTLSINRPVSINRFVESKCGWRKLVWHQQDRTTDVAIGLMFVVARPPCADGPLTHVAKPFGETLDTS
jgi:hypothetical protein